MHTIYWHDTGLGECEIKESRTNITSLQPNMSASIFVHVQIQKVVLYIPDMERYLQGGRESSNGVINIPDMERYLQGGRESSNGVINIEYVPREYLGNDGVERVQFYNQTKYNLHGKDQP